MMRSTRRDEGFALAALICIISAAAVLTAVMVPLRVMQTRRETEQELIFRGQEYIRAIQKYQRKYGVYPSSIDDLVSRDGYRFIRRQYKDPVTGEDFRLINVNADGSLTGSLTLLSLPMSTQQNAAPGTMPAANGTSPLSGGGGGGGNNTQGNTARNGVQNSANTSGVGTISGAGGGLGMSSNSGISGISNPTSGGGTNTNNNSRAGVGGGGVGSGAGTGGGAFGGGGATGGGAPGTLAAGAGAFGPMTNPLNGGGNTQAQGNNANRPGGATGTGGGTLAAGAPSALANNAGFASGGGGGLGGGGGAAAQISPGVAGVASESTKTAVMIYNEKEKYNEWEFISPLIQNQNQQGANNQQGGQQQGTNPRQQPQTSPFGQNPIGPTGNPLGGGGTNPVSGGGGGTGAGNPFGGNAPTTGGPGGAPR